MFMVSEAWYEVLTHPVAIAIYVSIAFVLGQLRGAEESRLIEKLTPRTQMRAIQLAPSEFYMVYCKYMMNAKSKKDKGKIKRSVDRHYIEEMAKGFDNMDFTYYDLHNIEAHFARHHLWR